jgi:ATP-dependent Lon protease
MSRRGPPLDDDSESEDEDFEQILQSAIDELLNDPEFRNNISIVIEQDKKKDPYLEKIGGRKRRRLEELEERLLKKVKPDKPLKYKILESDLSEDVKSQILEKINNFQTLNPSSGEFQKMRKYMNGLEKIPFGVYSRLPVSHKSDDKKVKDFFKKLQHDLSTCTYGQEKAKSAILEIAAKWITNPSSVGNVIGLCGPPGIGKTSLIKNGLAKSLNVPFSFVGLGGATCSAYLQGHDFTYEGSKWGRMIEILMEAKTMNPIIFFDELDKVSETKNGEEIIGILTHLTDPTQNNTYSDKYFSGIDFDFSKCLFIFSFNDESKLNPILKDRIKVIKLDGFKTDQKVEIAKRFSIKKICKNVGFKEKNIVFPDETLRFIAFTYCPEKGVRKLEKCIETIVMKLNLYSITNDLSYLSIKDKELLKNPYHVSVKLAASLLDPIFKREEISLSCQMMYS